MDQGAPGHRSCGGDESSWSWDEELAHALMSRLWDAAEYPSQAFEPAWRSWLDERGALLRTMRLVAEVDLEGLAGEQAEREQQIHEIVWAVADELCRARPATAHTLVPLSA